MPPTVPFTVLRNAFKTEDACFPPNDMAKPKENLRNALQRKKEAVTLGSYEVQRRFAFDAI